MDTRKPYSHIALITLIITICLTTGCEKIPTEIITTAPVDQVAVTTISEIDGSGVTGTATFTEVDSGVHVRIEIQNAIAGLHAMHLHTGSCTDIGPHWHPMGIPAGTPGIPVVQATLNTPPIGVGEIGNILVNEDGTGTLEFTTPFWSLGGDPNTYILGKLLLIHETADTFLTQPHAHQMQMDTDIEMNMNMEMDTQMVQPHEHPAPPFPRQHISNRPANSARRWCQNRLWDDNVDKIKMLDILSIFGYN